MFTTDLWSFKTSPRYASIEQREEKNVSPCPMNHGREQWSKTGRARVKFRRRLPLPPPPSSSNQPTFHLSPNYHQQHSGKCQSKPMNGLGPYSSCNSTVKLYFLPPQLSAAPSNQPTRITNSCCYSYSITKSVTWQYLGIQAWYHRSAGVKTTRNILDKKIQKKK